jgi:hypothetical protein
MAEKLVKRLPAKKKEDSFEKLLTWQAGVVIILNVAVEQQLTTFLKRC